jgi:hypothetical protein
LIAASPCQRAGRLRLLRGPSWQTRMTLLRQHFRIVGSLATIAPRCCPQPILSWTTMTEGGSWFLISVRCCSVRCRFSFRGSCRVGLGARKGKAAWDNFEPTALWTVPLRRCAGRSRRPNSVFLATKPSRPNCCATRSSSSLSCRCQRCANQPSSRMGRPFSRTSRAPR